MVVFPVTGSREGDYVHVGVIDHAGAYATLQMGKTFAGHDADWAFARRLADLLAL